MRMVNANDLEQALREAGLAEVIKDDCSKCTSAWGVPIVDAEEVVRCKDCWYSSVIPEEMQNVGEWHCEYWCAEMHDDDYCSCGKRRSDGDVV